VRWLEQHPQFGAVLGQVCNVDQETGRLGPVWPKALPPDGWVFRSLLRIQPQLGATLVRRSVVNAVGRFDEALLADEDWDWHLRIALHDRVGFVPVVSVLFQIRPEVADDDLNWFRFPYLQRVFWRNVQRGGPSAATSPATVRTYVNHLGVWHHHFIRSAKMHVQAGRLESARRSLGRAVRVSPLHFARWIFFDSETRSTVAAAFRLPGAPLDRGASQ